MKTFAVMLVGLCFLLAPKLGTGEMVAMSDSELSAVTAGGFSSFSLTNDGTFDIAKAMFNVQAETFTEIESMKLAHWDNGSGTPGWDQNWTGVDMGTSAENLVLKDFVMETTFTNVNDPQNRELESVTIGFNNVTGTMSADFQSLSRLTGTQYENRQNEGPATYQFNGDKLLLTINVKGDNRGIWVDMGDALKK